MKKNKWIIIGIIVVFILLNSSTKKTAIANFSSLTYDTNGFSTNFDSGMLGSATKVSDTEYSLTLKSSPLGGWHTAWINFVKKDVGGKTITFNILNVKGVGQFNQTPARPMRYSCDGINWNTITNTNTNSQTKYWFTHTFECDIVQIATYYPLPYDEVMSYLDSKSSSPYVSITTIGNSIEGRAIKLIELTNKNIAEDQKKHVMIISRQHPAETFGGHMIQGMIDYLLENTQLLDKLHFYIVPASNPDGIVDGYTRTNSQLSGCTSSNSLCDMNRGWGGTSNLDVNLIRTKFREIDSLVGVDFFIDWHGYAGGEQSTSLYAGNGIMFNTFAALMKTKWASSKVGTLYSSGSGSTCTQSSSSGSTGVSFGCSLGADSTMTFEPGQSHPGWTVDLLHKAGQYTAESIYSTYYGDIPPIPITPVQPHLPAVAYYPFSGNANAAIGSYNGVVTNALLTTDKNSNTNSAYSFDGDSDYITLGDMDYVSSGRQWSFSAWYYLNDATQKERAILFKDGSFHIVVGKVFGEVEVADRTDFTSATTAGQSVKSNVWQHIAVTYDGKDCRIYIDGIDRTTYYSVNIIENNNPLLISRNSATSAFNGKLDEVYFFDYALTTNEVQYLYQGVTSPYATFQGHHQKYINGEQTFSQFISNANQWIAG